MKNIAILFFIVVSLLGCTNETTEPIPKAPNNQEVIREVALIVGTVMTNPDVKNEILDAMALVDEFNELVSISYLIGGTDNLRENEVSFLEQCNEKKQGRTSLFKKAITAEFTANQNQYPALKKEIRNRDLVSTRIKSFSHYCHLAGLLENKQLQIFFPYGHTMGPQETLSSFYVSYDPMTTANTNEAFLFEVGRDGHTLISDVNNEFVDNNPVFGIVPIDPCDIPGAPCEFVDAVPAETGVGGMPPVFPNVATLITHNFRHEDVTDDKDMITSRIPQVRIQGTSWLGFLGTHQKLRIYRGGAALPIKILPDGTVMGIGQLVAASRIPRRYIVENDRRLPRWVNINGNFDADWRMAKHTQNLAVFSIHHFAPPNIEISATFRAGVTINPATGAPVPTVEFNRSGKLTLQANQAKFRGMVELSRRQVFATNVGRHSTGIVRTDWPEQPFDGVDYNVKDIGIIQYFFQHWHTSLVTTN